ncbi:MAG: hypothetical protein CSA21_00530 [Deltaproteobacteria bacterium]|nr:MAG: hypothetical protein CSA21_00530 [Deltaproteobacteria bacterium]
MVKRRITPDPNRTPGSRDPGKKPLYQNPMNLQHSRKNVKLSCPFSRSPRPLLDKVRSICEQQKLVFANAWHAFSC